MQEYITKGTIITEKISTRDIESGTICIIDLEDRCGKDRYNIVTIQHITKEGDWMVEGSYTGSLSSDTPLYRLSIKIEERIIPIGFKYWEKIIKHNLIGKDEHSFLIKPKPFNPGKYVKTCSECWCSFLAGKRQPYCKTCCDDLSTAHLIFEGKQNKKKEKMFPESFVTELTVDAFNSGKNGILHSNFYNWLQTKLKSYGNNNN